MYICPECEIPMEKAGAIDVCIKCKGMFFEFDEMNMVLKNALQEKFTEMYSGDKTPDHKRAYVCPKCGIDMKQEEYGFNSGIHIDRCLECLSIFLNGGESIEINKYLSTGESKDVYNANVEKIEMEYDEKWKNMVLKISEQIQRDGLI